MSLEKSPTYRYYYRHAMKVNLPIGGRTPFHSQYNMTPQIRKYFCTEKNTMFSTIKVAMAKQFISIQRHSMMICDHSVALQVFPYIEMLKFERCLLTYNKNRCDKNEYCEKVWLPNSEVQQCRSISRYTQFVSTRHVGKFGQYIRRSIHSTIDDTTI